MPCQPTGLVPVYHQRRHPFSAGEFVTSDEKMSRQGRDLMSPAGCSTRRRSQKMSRRWLPFPSNLSRPGWMEMSQTDTPSRAEKWPSCALEGWKDVTKFHSANRKRCHGTVAGSRLAKAAIHEPRFVKDVTPDGSEKPHSGDSKVAKDVTDHAWVLAGEGSRTTTELQKDVTDC
jgi:hypothetical protein